MAGLRAIIRVERNLVGCPSNFPKISSASTQNLILSLCRDRGKCYSKYIGRESRFMAKMLSRNAPKRKYRFYESPSQDTALSLGKPKKIVNTKRISVLNKVFMEHITNLLLSGSISEEIINSGVQITKVAMSPDFSNINVFWTSPPLNEDIESILHDVSYLLRHELSQLRVMGQVPKLTFVKDNEKDKITQVEKLIEQVSNERHAEDNDLLDDTECYETYSVMISNVYGLERNKILKKMGFDSGSNYKQGINGIKKTAKELSRKPL